MKVFWFCFVSLFELFTIGLLVERHFTKMHAAILIVEIFCILGVGLAESVFSHRYMFDLVITVDSLI